MDKAIENIFLVNLGVRRPERVLVFADVVRDDEDVSEADRVRREGARAVAKRAAEAGAAFAKTFYVEFPAGGSHGKEPPVLLWEAAFGIDIVKRLKKEKVLEPLISKTAGESEVASAEAIIAEMREDTVDCVVALSNYSTTHTRFRKLLTDCAGVRYASMPNFDESMLEGVMKADWDKVKARTVKVADTMNGADSVKIETPNGTSIRFSIKGRSVIADTGILIEEGSSGNLPAGEAFVAPVEGSAEGVLVLDWAPMRKLKSPVRLTIQAGTVVGVSGEEEYARVLEAKLAENPLCGNIAELGVGTNDMAKRADNILESEKILGTIHIALGDNSTFGGKVSVPFHQDFVFFGPTLEIEKDGKKSFVLRKGVPMV